MTDKPSSRRLRRRGRQALPVLAFLLPLPASAWNAAGHRLVASIAWDQLDARDQQAVARLLRAHPDYPRWIRRAGAAAEERTAFIAASTWPDEIRHDARFYDAGVDEPTPALDGFPDMLRHRDWHYVNRPLDDVQGDRARSGQIGQQLVRLRKVLRPAADSDSQRAYALVWLIHLVADAHQPLHVGMQSGAAERQRAPGGERVINPYNPRKRNSTLHAFWDDLPGPSWLRGQKLDAAGSELTALYPPPPPSAPGQWLEESWQIARVDCYPAADNDQLLISAAFHQSAAEIARRRIATAGYRLADELRAAVVLPRTSAIR